MADAKTVFISNLGPGHDYSSAARWGAIRAITHGNYPIFKTERLVDEIVQSLSESSPDDYLLLSGSSVIAGLCQAVWLTLHPSCNLLLFDRKSAEGGSYILRAVSLNQIVHSIERQKDVQELQARKVRATKQ